MMLNTLPQYDIEMNCQNIARRPFLRAKQK